MTFALGAAAIAGGCSSKGSGNGSIGDGSMDCGSNEPAGVCPDEQPCPGAPCDLPSWAVCVYGPGTSECGGIWAACRGGSWSVNPPICHNPPTPVYEAGPGPDVYEGGPDVSDGGSDGGGQDGGRLADATGDVTPDAESE